MTTAFVGGFASYEYPEYHFLNRIFLPEIESRVFHRRYVKLRSCNSADDAVL